MVGPWLHVGHFEVVTMATWEIQGRQVAMPVRVRDATLTAATFTCPVPAAARVLEDTPYVPASTFGRAFTTLACVSYRDGDLDAYDEIGLLLAVEGPDGVVGTWTADLPVTQGFTLEAGNRIWGLPKWLGRIHLGVGRTHTRVQLHDADQHVLSGVLRHGWVPWPWRTGTDLVTWTTQPVEGRAHPGRAAGRMELTGVRLRPGGARIDLGDHPMADRARLLGVGGRPLMTMHAPRMTLSLGEVEPPRSA